MNKPQILKKHAEKYPLMRPEDAVKLLFQSEFGGGHMIEDEGKSLSLLKKELKNSEGLFEPPFEDIGGGMIRFSLKSGFARNELAPEVINRAFISSSGEVKGSRESFLNSLDFLKKLAKEGVFGFSYEELSDYIAEYIKKDCPPVSHSESYRQAYAPAYRILKKEYVFVLHIAARILRLLNQRERAAVAIDGRAASGKTTMAERLAYIFGCGVFHTDDFFLPFDMRTKERLDEPGGNIHYERLKSELIEGIKSGKEFKYGAFSCKTGETHEKKSPPQPLCIVEGVYSTHPYLGNPYNLRVFMSVDPEEQKKRIIARDGEELYKSYESLWIPMEEKYFLSFDITHKCDVSAEI